MRSVACCVLVVCKISRSERILPRVVRCLLPFFRAVRWTHQDVHLPSTCCTCLVSSPISLCPFLLPIKTLSTHFMSFDPPPLNPPHNTAHRPRPQTLLPQASKHAGSSPSASSSPSAYYQQPVVLLPPRRPGLAGVHPGPSQVRGSLPPFASFRRVLVCASACKRCLYLLAPHVS